MNENDKSSIEELKVRITADTSDLKKKVEEVKGSLNNFSNSTNKINIEANSSGIKSTVNSIKKGVTEGIAQGVNEALTSDAVKQGTSKLGTAAKGALAGATQGFVALGIGKELTSEIDKTFKTFTPSWNRKYKEAMKAAMKGSPDLAKAFLPAILEHLDNYSMKMKTAVAGMNKALNESKKAIEEYRKSTGDTTTPSSKIDDPAVEASRVKMKAALNEYAEALEYIKDLEEAYKDLSEVIGDVAKAQEKVNEAMGKETPKAKAEEVKQEAKPETDKAAETATEAVKEQGEEMVANTLKANGFKKALEVSFKSIGGFAGKLSKALSAAGISLGAIIPVVLAVIAAIKLLSIIIGDIKKTCQLITAVAKKTAEIFAGLMKSIIGAFGTAGQTAVKAFGVALTGVYNTAKKLASIFEFDFKNGIDRLYTWSKLNKSGFSGALDGITSNLHALENSLATMASAIYESFSPVIDAITDKVLILTNAVSKMMAQLSGKSSYTKVIKATTEYSKATDKASSSLQRFLLGIDELEKVPENDLEEITNSFTQVSEDIDQIAPLQIGANLGKSLSDWLDDINWTSIKSKAQAIGDKVASLLNGIFATKDLGKKIGTTIAEAINTAFEYVESFFKTFNGAKFGQFISDAVAGFFKGLDYNKIHSAVSYMIEDIVQSINTFLQDQERVKAVANGIYTLISNAIEDVRNLITGIDWQTLAVNIGTLLTSALEAIDPQAIVETLCTLINAALDILINIPWAKMAEVAMNLVNELITGFTEIVQSGKLEEIVDGVIEGINTIIDNLDGGKIAEFINVVIDAAGRIWEKIRTGIDWQKLVDEISEAMANINWTEAMKVVFDVFAKTWVFKNIFKAEIFFNIVDGIVQSIKDAFSQKLQDWFGMGEELANGIVNGITTVLKLSNPFYWLYQGAKVAVKAVKSLFTGTSFFSDNTSYSLTGVNGYASGGVITRPELAMVGEYAGARSNPEIITPESKMREIFDASNSSLADTYIQVGRQIIQAIENQNLEVSIGDDTIARSAARGNNNYRRMTGKALISAY